MNPGVADLITVRRASGADREFVAGLAPSLLDCPSPAWEDPAVLSTRYGDALARAVDQQGADSTVLIAQNGDGLALGFISLRVGRDAAGFVRAHVADVAVVADARRSGVGSALMRAAEVWAHEHDLAMLELDVWATNDRALSFYRSLGYREESLTLFKPLEP